LSVVRADDGAVVDSADLDLSQGAPDALGFKYAKFSSPVRLEPGPEAVVIFPAGLDPERIYEVSCDRSDCRTRKAGVKLGRDGIRLASVQPGELIYLNLPKHPGSGTDKIAPDPPRHAIQRVGSNLGVQGVELAWDPGRDDNWISYYEVLRDGVLLGKVAKGTFFFDHSGNAQQLAAARYELRAVDGDGNRSASVTATAVPGEKETYRALGGFSATQGQQQWRYEQSSDGETFLPMAWTAGGYEGRWAGYELARIGRIWMQPGATADVARVFVSPANGVVSIAGEIRKDPSSRDGDAVRSRVLVNDRQIWPEGGWQEISPDYDRPTPLRLDRISVKAGDALRFVVSHTGSGNADPVIWDPTITIERTP
jgi:hypothetical protein